MVGVIGAASVKSSSLHVALPLWFRLNVTPFLISYMICFWGYFFNYEAWEDIPLFVVPVLAIIQGLSILSCFWSVHIHSFLSCRSVNEVKSGVWVKIVPKANKGASTFVPVQFRKEDQRYFISWRKRTLIWVPELKQFKKNRFPIDLPFSDYLNCSGYTSDDARNDALLKWDNNR